MKKNIVIIVVIIAIFCFNSCVTTNKGFQSSPVIARNVTLDPIKADVVVDETHKLTGEATVKYVLCFKSGNKQFADGINYSTESQGGLKNLFRAAIVNEARSAAAYQALKQCQDCDVLVHPTYEVTIKKSPLGIFLRKYTVKVNGYGAKYTNFRTEKQKIVITNNAKEYVFPDSD